MNTETDTVVLRHGWVARLLLVAFASVWIYQFASPFFRNVTTQSVMASMIQFALISLVVLGVIAVGWMRITFNPTTIRSHVPFITSRTVQWSDITSYRKRFPSNALFANETITLKIPAMLPRLDLLWSECERRGIAPR